MREQVGGCASMRSSLRAKRWELRGGVWMAPALLVIGLACSGGGMPHRGDLAAIEREATAEESEADTSGSPARQGVRDALRQVLGACDRHGAEIGRTFWRPE